jgi:hypothetical protein
VRRNTRLGRTLPIDGGSGRSRGFPTHRAGASDQLCIPLRGCLKLTASRNGWHSLTAGTLSPCSSPWACPWRRQPQVPMPAAGSKPLIACPCQSSVTSCPCSRSPSSCDERFFGGGRTGSRRIPKDYRWCLMARPEKRYLNVGGSCSGRMPCGFMPAAVWQIGRSVSVRL